MTVVATRILKLRREQDQLDIPVHIFAPERDDAAFACRFEIDWPEGHHHMKAFGVDAVQALVLALQMISAEIYASEHHRSGQLMFDAPGSGYGFPVAPSLRGLLVGDDVKFFG
jgi:hypothetical protein